MCGQLTLINSESSIHKALFIVCNRHCSQH